MISIIIPMYNSEKTIIRCLQSVTKQNYDKFEIIVIDDGSLDNSFSLVQAKAHDDERIKLINKENGGVSSARNVGLNNARFDYITFLDSDDELSEDALEVILNNIDDDYDLIIFGYYEITKNKTNIRNTDSRIYSSMYDLLSDYHVLNENNLFNPPFNKVYKRNLIKRYYDENLNLGEDLKFNIEYLSNCKNIKVSKDLIYMYYAETENSLSKKYNLHTFFQIKKAYKPLIDLFAGKNIKNTSLTSIYNKVFIMSLYCVQSVLTNRKYKHKEKRSYYYNVIKDELFIEARSKSNLHTVQYSLFSVFSKIGNYPILKVFFMTKRTILTIKNVLKIQKTKKEI